jgi:hypothetical protein
MPHREPQPPRCVLRAKTQRGAAVGVKPDFAEHRSGLQVVWCPSGARWFIPVHDAAEEASRGGCSVGVDGTHDLAQQLLALSGISRHGRMRRQRHFSNP